MNEDDILWEVKKSISQFKSIFSRTHRYERTAERLNLGIYFWKLRKWHSLKLKEIALIYSWIGNHSEEEKKLIETDRIILNHDNESKVIGLNSKRNYVSETILIVDKLIKNPPPFPPTLPL